MQSIWSSIINPTPLVNVMPLHTHARDWLVVGTWTSPVDCSLMQLLRVMVRIWQIIRREIYSGSLVLEYWGWDSY